MTGNARLHEAHWRYPEVPEDAKVLFEEPGRTIDHGQHKVDYSSHWFRVVQPEFSEVKLLVRHGGGDESFGLGHKRKNGILDILALLTSEQRYLLLYKLYDTHREAKRNATEETAARFKKAFVDGRLKKRKIRGQDAYKVTCEREGAI